MSPQVGINTVIRAITNDGYIVWLPARIIAYYADTFRWVNSSNIWVNHTWTREELMKNIPEAYIEYGTHVI